MHRIWLSFLVCAVIAGPAAGHDLWIEADSTGARILYGHRGSGHSGPERIETPRGFVRGVVCLTPEGRIVEPDPPDTLPGRIPGRVAAIHVEASSGVWTRTPRGVRNLPKDRVAQPIEAWESHESAKRIASWSEALRAPMSGALEIVPLEDPFAVAPGEKIRLLVTLDRAPVEGAVVSYHGK
ncbi:MAG: hypothetical protein GF346_11905, partial [Candidatus Eisenbacteria bacterium]|nr:hypothetical protein [Candidatus Latescibacterota bacterium]MBD3303140.1 hypothetical protein [Candidatus Eisenbacteria bacterium]